jgi:hypothetical protein
MFVGWRGACETVATAISGAAKGWTGQDGVTGARAGGSGSGLAVSGGGGSSFSWMTVGSAARLSRWAVDSSPAATVYNSAWRATETNRPTAGPVLERGHVCMPPASIEIGLTVAALQIA